MPEPDKDVVQPVEQKEVSNVSQVESKKQDDFKTPLQKRFDETLKKEPSQKPPDEEKKKAEDQVKPDIEKKIQEETEKAKKQAEEQKKQEEEKNLKEQEDKKKLEATKVEALKDETIKELEELRARVAEYDKDPLVAVKKYHPQIFENLEAAKDLNGFLAKWQQTTLLEQLKKKFPDKVTDEWTFDVSEAYQAGTPSYEWRTATDDKRKQVVEALQAQQAKEQAIVQAYIKQRDADIAFLKENYGYTDEVFKNKLKQFDLMHQEVLEGKATPDKHPFSLRNLFRGMFFDELVAEAEKKSAEKATNELKELYKQKGITLSETIPTDISAAKSAQMSPENESKKKKMSPLAAQMERFANT